MKVKAQLFNQLCLYHHPDQWDKVSHCNIWCALNVLMRDCAVHWLALRGLSGQRTACRRRGTKLKSALENSAIMGHEESLTRWWKPNVLLSVNTLCFLLTRLCTAHTIDLAPVTRMTLPFFAWQVDHNFLSYYAWHLTQIWDAFDASYKLPMAKQTGCSWPCSDLLLLPCAVPIF